MTLGQAMNRRTVAFVMLINDFHVVEERAVLVAHRVLVALLLRLHHDLVAVVCDNHH